MFMEKLEDKTNVSYTEKGMKGYKTTKNKLLDLNFQVPSLRSASELDILKKFRGAFKENEELAVKWLFFARDVRGGMGGRRLFRICFKWIAQQYPNKIKLLLTLIPEFGRWDDLIMLLEHRKELDESVINYIVGLIKSQLLSDSMQVQRGGYEVSLMTKWLPSINSRDSKKREVAKFLCISLNLSPKEYRKLLSSVRKQLNIVETKMSENRWEDIEYSKVPSRAGMIYRNAFMKHDEDRYRDFIEKAKTGQVKANSQVLYPYEILHSAGVRSYWGYDFLPENFEVPDALWNNLPELNVENSTLVVADGSGSMTVPIGNTSITAWEVAHSLAFYFSQYNQGEFKDRYISFGSNPELVDLSDCEGLYEKIEIASQYSDYGSTNIQKVLQLILDTVVDYEMEPNELPKTILIISDMEFDEGGLKVSYGRNVTKQLDNVFEQYQTLFSEYGYMMPKLVFWNVNSRTNTIPLKENESGLILLSGFSPNVYKMVETGKLDPYEALVTVLCSERYQNVIWK